MIKANKNNETMSRFYFPPKTERYTNSLVDQINSTQERLGLSPSEIIKSVQVEKHCVVAATAFPAAPLSPAAPTLVFGTALWRLGNPPGHRTGTVRARPSPPMRVCAALATHAARPIE